MARIRWQVKSGAGKYGVSKGGVGAGKKRAQVKRAQKNRTQWGSGVIILKVWGFLGPGSAVLDRGKKILLTCPPAYV